MPPPQFHANFVDVIVVDEERVLEFGVGNDEAQPSRDSFGVNP